MPNLRNYLFLVLIAIMSACGSDEPTTTEQPEVSNFDSFAKHFDSISLPYSLPNPELSKENVLNKDFIARFFKGVKFEPAFDEQNDVPGLAENAESARYYATGAFRDSAFTAYIIHKKEQADYYYLVTMNNEGEYIQGMCIAFLEAEGDDKTERRADINDDYIGIMQLNTLSGMQTEDEQRRFFEVTPEGRINLINNKTAS